MTKLLNLDALPTTSEYTIRLKGVDHPMVPISVGKFLAQQKLAKKVDTAGDTAEQFSSLIDMIADTFPSIGRPALEEMNFAQLNAIFEFITATGEAGAITAAGATNAEGVSAESAPAGE